MQFSWDMLHAHKFLLELKRMSGYHLHVVLE